MSPSVTAGVGSLSDLGLCYAFWGHVICHTSSFSENINVTQKGSGVPPRRNGVVNTRILVVVRLI